MKTNEPLKTEDILADELFSAKIIQGSDPERSVAEEEYQLAHRIQKTISSQRPLFRADDKDFLGKSITETINRSKRKSLIIRYSIAASIIVILGVTALFRFQSESEISRFASQIKVNPQIGFTQLLLASDQVIKIETQESKIAYSPNGQEINIDEQGSIEQQITSGAKAYNTVVVPYGKRSKITLPDNSTIWLNSGTKLVYPAQFANEKREVFLEGEAIFDVTPNKKAPFHVVTKQLEVKVLGTNFDLCAYADDSLVNTILVHGSVELSYNKSSIFGASKEIMVPGMLAAYDLKSKKLVQQNVDTKDFLSWKEGYLIMKKNTLSNIVQKLSRYYNVSIEIENQELLDVTFSGQLDLRSSAIDVLKLISETIDIEFEQSGQLIRIKKRNLPS